MFSGEPRCQSEPGVRLARVDLTLMAKVDLGNQMHNNPGSTTTGESSSLATFFQPGFHPSFSRFSPVDANNPFSPPTAQVAQTREPESERLAGIGGWLVLVGLGIVVSPLGIVVKLLPTYLKLFTDGSWLVLTTPGSAVYHPLWMPYLLIEVIVNAGLFVAWVWIATRFFARKQNFPRLYISILTFTIAFQFLDALAITVVSPTETVFDPDTIKELGWSIIEAMIWIPYMLRSKRVRATFTR